MFNISQKGMPQKQRGNRPNAIRTPIASFGWVMIILLLSLGAINFSDKAVLGLAAVPIIKELHLSPAQYGLVSGSLFWLFALSSVLVTAWSDHIGTKKVLALLATIWAIVQFATLLVFSFPALLLTRIVLGAGEGPYYGTSVSAATPWLPSDRRAFGLAVFTFGFYIGPAVFGPPLTFVIVLVGWRAAFALLGGIGMLWVIIWLLVGREHPEMRRMPVQETQVEHPGFIGQRCFHSSSRVLSSSPSSQRSAHIGQLRSISVGTRSTWSPCVTSSSVIPSTLQGSRFPIL